MLNQYCLDITKQIKLVLGDTLGQEMPNLHDSYKYTVYTTVLYDKNCNNITNLHTQGVQTILQHCQI